ncbi:class I SAM-dependent methyltransferase [Kitasatospora paracochleata]|uniref:class I SAM-dependent methyltransferase n=1 Tax=Kitasatospora paracochleata TaxID=58354 RepID=UPI0020A4CFC5|nr:class I SAM-dependent methyltransferase [Kitasatospora paracochleata]
MSDSAPSAPVTPDDVPGWFFPVDQAAFAWFLSRQTDAGTTGDLLELGAYLGRSAILLGDHLQPGESFTVCDLFDSEAPDSENSAEMAMSYRDSLTRRAFEANYLAFHPQLPTVIQAPTSVLADGRIRTGSCRFVHVDASHLYEHVAGDIQVARDALAKEGLVALDDYRSPHTPGVSAAVWEAVFDHGLKPVLLTPEKFYGTWGDADALTRVLLERDWRGEGFRMDEELIAGQVCHRLAKDPAPAPGPAPRSAAPQRSAARRLALDVLPPFATRATRRALRAARARRSH